MRAPVFTPHEIHVQRNFHEIIRALRERAGARPAPTIALKFLIRFAAMLENIRCNGRGDPRGRPSFS